MLKLSYDLAHLKKLQSSRALHYESQIGKLQQLEYLIFNKEQDAMYNQMRARE